MQWPLVLILTLAAVLAGGCATFDGIFHGDGARHVTPTGVCVEPTPESRLHAIRACELAETYEIVVGKSHYVYRKADFQRELRTRLRSYLRQTRYPAHAWSEAQLAIWIEVPQFHPYEASLLVVVDARRGRFYVRLPLALEGWTPTPASTIWLGEDPFPSRDARRIGALVVHERGRSYLVATEPFGEAAMALSLLEAPEARRLQRRVERPLAGEREGAKAKAFEFNMAER